MISLISHLLKAFIRIIYNRIYRKCEGQVNDTQFGFRNGVKTREALFSLNVLTQQCRDVNYDVYACFVDYRKAFDCVNHEKMVAVLKEAGIDRSDIRIITHLYWAQTAEVKISGQASDQIQIKKGVRQGCVLSPLLFNIYSEAVFREALTEASGGVIVNGKIINNLRYADDTVLLASSEAELQLMVEAVAHYSARWGLFMNIAKTKVMVFAKSPKRATILVDGSQVEQVESYRYLGALVNQFCDPKKELRSRIGLARQAFLKMRKFFIRSDISLSLRVRMLRCYIFSVFLYGCESWTLDPVLEERMNALELYFYRRMLRISWVQKVTNEEVLARMGKQRELLLTFKERKTRYFGHVMRGDKYELLRLIIQGKIAGKRSIGRRQNSWMKDLRRWFGITSVDIFRGATSREKTAEWIADLRMEMA